MTTEFQSMKSGPLPMKRGRLIKNLADSTISNVIDAVVELITNSDDSYSREEQVGVKLSGQINIYISRLKGGHCSSIKVVDGAAGMDHVTLERAIEFAGDTSGFKEGRTVRGFFGRGLKEAIIALGKGTILTLREGVLSRAVIHYDEKQREAIYNLAIPVQNVAEDELKSFGFIDKSGTIISIDITNDKKDHIPGRATIEIQLASHFALRDINSSPLRLITLYYSEPDSKDRYSSSLPIKYSSPVGKLIKDEDKKVLEDKVHFRIFESTERLETPTYTFGTAGLLIKTEGAILDNQLFGFETEPTALHFFGEIICPGIAKIVREGDETIIDINRGGLDRKHPYFKELEQVSREVLSEIIREKKDQMKMEKRTRVSDPIQKMLDKICRKLSELAKTELEEIQPGRGEVESLIIRPLFANLNQKVSRPFTVYIPKYLSKDEGTNIVRITSPNPNIRSTANQIALGFYEKDNNILKGVFNVVGDKMGESATITASLGKLVATCEARVAPLGKIGKRKKKDQAGGLFTKVEPAPDEDPIQRFRYDEGGIIKVYVNFPGLKVYLGENFDKVESQEGRAILAEILIEAFCRHISRQHVGLTIAADVDALVGDMDRLRRLSSPIVYEIIFGANLKDILLTN